jgi:hypothetical protein
VTNYHITVYGADRTAMADIVRLHGVRVYGQTLKAEAAGLQVDGVGDDAAISRLTEAGYRVERHEDLDEAAQESLGDVGTGNLRLREARWGTSTSPRWRRLSSWLRAPPTRGSPR